MDETEDDSLEKPQLQQSNRLSPKKLEEQDNLPFELQSIDWSSVVPEIAGSYTVIVGGKPVQILVQTDDDTPVRTSSPKHHIELDNQNILDGVDDKSLLSNSDLKTDDTREDLTDVSRKQIDLNNPSTSMEVSVSDTELESTADKDSAGEKPENSESNTNSAGEKPRVSGGSGEPNISSEKGESNMDKKSAGEKCDGGSGEPNINSEKGESNANSVGEKPGLSGGSGEPNINS